MSTEGAITRLQQNQILQAWFSPQFPTGGFAFSHGLEALVFDGKTEDFEGFCDWLTEILSHGAGRNDAILISAAYQNDDWREVNDLALANCASHNRWVETTTQGMAFAKTVNASYGLALDTSEPLASPVAVGLAAKAMGLELPDVIAGYLQAFVSTLCYAGVRLVPLGQTQAQQAIAGQFEGIARLVAGLPDLGLDDIGTDLWLADTASLAQEEMETRVFRS